MQIVRSRKTTRVLIIQLRNILPTYRLFFLVLKENVYLHFIAKFNEYDKCQLEFFSVLW